LIYGYARVSTKGQAKDGNGLDVQRAALKAAGADEIYEEAFIGTKKDRPELNRLLEDLQSGDTLVVTKLDRIARSASQGAELVQKLLKKNVTVRILNMGVIDGTPAGKLITTVMFAFAEFERDMIVERTQEGKAVARIDPNYREGRPRKYSPVQLQHAMSLLNDHSYKQVEAMTGISVPTLSRERRRQNLIAARYKAPSEDEILNASLVNQMCITDFPEFMPASD
jgi:DNA invertase Pin-like site-specific DNA recombinase